MSNELTVDLPMQGRIQPGTTRQKETAMRHSSTRNGIYVRLALLVLLPSTLLLAQNNNKKTSTPPPAPSLHPPKRLRQHRPDLQVALPPATAMAPRPRRRSFGSHYEQPRRRSGPRTTPTPIKVNPKGQSQGQVPLPSGAVGHAFTQRCAENAIDERRHASEALERQGQ